MGTYTMSLRFRRKKQKGLTGGERIRPCFRASRVRPLYLSVLQWQIQRLHALENLKMTRTSLATKTLVPAT